MKAVADPGRLGNELVTGVDEQLQVGIELRHAHPGQVRLAPRDPGDGYGVALVVLAPPAVRAPTLCSEVGGNVDNALVCGQEPSCER